MIENTSRRDPLLHLAGSMSGGGPSGYIEEMESAGQAQLVASEQMPADAPLEELTEILAGSHSAEKIERARSNGMGDYADDLARRAGWARMMLEQATAES